VLIPFLVALPAPEAAAAGAAAGMTTERGSGGHRPAPSGSGRHHPAPRGSGRHRPPPRRAGACATLSAGLEHGRREHGAGESQAEHGTRRRLRRHPGLRQDHQADPRRRRGSVDRAEPLSHHPAARGRLVPVPVPALLVATGGDKEEHQSSPPKQRTGNEEEEESNQQV